MSRESDPEFDRLLAEEELILAATELVAEAMSARGTNRKGLADLLGVSQGEITQRMSGTRNLTLRSLASMLHVLGVEATIVEKHPQIAALSGQALSAPRTLRSETIAPPLRLIPGGRQIAAGGDWHPITTHPRAVAQ